MASQSEEEVLWAPSPYPSHTATVRRSIAVTPEFAADGLAGNRLHHVAQRPAASNLLRMSSGAKKTVCEPVFRPQIAKATEETQRVGSGPATFLAARCAGRLGASLPALDRRAIAGPITECRRNAPPTPTAWHPGARESRDHGATPAAAGRRISAPSQAATANT